HYFRDLALNYLTQEQFMRILILGATGFIGKNLVRFLSENGHGVYGFVHQKEQNQPSQVQLETLSTWLTPARILAGDLTKETLSSKWLQKNNIDTVIYAASQLDVNQAQIDYGNHLYWGQKSSAQPKLIELVQNSDNQRGVEMDVAATKIQKHIRGYLVRKNR
ncbi:MAG TPA: NAD-dependent epimerase/dehydratase family protein, partial [Candidatus Berkiella sp.]|nr:NAD-dependent epimerase/dehydratase family protein [Candidatus Berkiella sp.]